MHKIPIPLSPKLLKKEKNKAIFEIGGCYPGYGVTLGNALRRVLLSSLGGAAITGVKIKGVSHEFSTIPYILEDVVSILLNLKQVRLKVFSGEEPIKAFLKVKGEREVKASDIKVPSNVEIINKDCHIATLTDKKGELDMEIEIETGLGYVPVEARKKEKLEVGKVALDAIFTPIKKVNYEVENMRVGDRTDFNRLIIDLETDGTISPEEALARAAEILVNQFTVISKLAKDSDERKTLAKKTEKIQVKGKTSKAQEEILKTKIENLKLSSRTKKALMNNKIKTLKSLIRFNEESILSFEGLGEKGLKEIKKVLKKLNLSLKQ